MATLMNPDPRELDVDFDLRSALSVEPSARFATHVRSRIEAEREHTARYARRLVLGAMLATAATAVVVALATSARPERTVRMDAPGTATIPAPGDIAHGSPPEGTEPPAPSQTARRPGSGDRRTRESLPEIVVSQGEVRAMRSLIALANSNDESVAAMFAEASNAEPMHEITIRDIVIQPLLVEPLDQETD